MAKLISIFMATMIMYGILTMIINRNYSKILFEPQPQQKSNSITAFKNPTSIDVKSKPLPIASSNINSMMLETSLMQEMNNVQNPTIDGKSKSLPLASPNINATILETSLMQEMNLGENSSPESPLQNCPVTTNVQITMIHHDLDRGEGDGSRWILQALTKNGEKKSVGGDEFYVTYTDDNAVFANSTARGESGKDEKELDPTAVAIITDIQDGTYALRFKTTPMNPYPTNLSGTGTLNIYLQYTCGIGKLPMPSKSSWESNGSSRQKLHIVNVPQPPIQYYERPPVVDLSRHKMVIFFGDSMLRMMVTEDEESVNKYKKKWYKPNVAFRFNVRSHLSTNTVQHFIDQFNLYHENLIFENRPSVALVIGSSAWDLIPFDDTDPGYLAQGSTFDDHILACKQLIQYFQEKSDIEKIYWRLPSAMHIHRINCAGRRKRVRACNLAEKYISSSRSEYLYHKQKTLMQEMNMTYFDFYDTTYLSAHNMLNYDARHFTASFNRNVLDWFYPSNSTTAAATVH